MHCYAPTFLTHTTEESDFSRYVCCFPVFQILDSSPAVSKELGHLPYDYAEVSEWETCPRTERGCCSVLAVRTAACQAGRSCPGGQGLQGTEPSTCCS